MSSLEGKVAIVTGAGRGIGREHALALARAGARVVVNDRGGSLAGEGEDASPAQEVVNETVEEWDAVIAVHLKGHFAPLRHAAAYWRERSKAGEEVRGRVITTASPSGVFGNVGQANYGAAKAGIAGLTLIAAQELERYGVTVNCLAPNARTRMTEETFGELARPEDGFDPLDPGNMAPVVVALAADEAQDITGQCFFVWGGVVNVLQPWQAGEAFVAEERWDADELLSALRERFPEGAKPIGMLAAMEQA